MLRASLKIETHHSPLAKAKALVKTYADELGDDGVDLMGPREDLVNSLQFLDVGVPFEHQIARRIRPHVHEE